MNETWKDRHDAAWFCPRLGHESALVNMARGWADYASAHQRVVGKPSDDYVPALAVVMSRRGL